MNQPALLVIEILTPHGSPVPGATVRLIGATVECLGAETSPGSYAAALPNPDDYILIVERSGISGGFDHKTLRTTLFYCIHPEAGPLVVGMEQPEGEISRVAGITRDGSLFRLRVTLDYLFFTHIGSPPTLGNRVDVLTDGEEGWAAVARAIGEAKLSLHLVTWVYQPTAELLRPAPLTDPEERAPFTVHSLLEQTALRGVRVRLLLWDAPFIDVPVEARRAGRAAGDNFEVMQEANPTRRPLLNDSEWHLYNKLLGDFQIGSYHQKTVVVDGRIGFCTGMNLKENDWDTHAHALFEPARCRFSRPSLFRQTVLEHVHIADHRPRHDFMARVEGPVVEYLEENFRERWNRLIEQRARWSENATPLPPHPPEAPPETAAASPSLFPDGAIKVTAPEADVHARPPALSTESASPVPEPPRIAAAPGASQAQVIRTMPAPRPERGILDVYRRAIGCARRLIYIEDQYFRSVHVSDALADAARMWPDLKIIVLTVEQQADSPFAGSWARATFERVKDRRPDFELYTLRVAARKKDGEPVTDEVDNHAKLLIVDDLFFTVGSCNLNDRGFEFEGELNIAVADAALAKDLRISLWRSHLGGDDRISGDIDADVALWKEHAEKNRAYDPKSGAPLESHVFPFEPRASRTLVFGHDVF